MIHLENANLYGFVVPAKAGTQPNQALDSRLRGNDELVCATLNLTRAMSPPLFTKGDADYITFRHKKGRFRAPFYLPLSR